MVGYQMDVDGNFTNNYRPLPQNLTRLQEEENRRGDFAGYKSVDYDYKSSRKNKTWTGMTAAFVDAEDVVPLQLLFSLSKRKPWRNFGGYYLDDIIRSDEIMVWTKDDEAIVCFVGQNIAKDSKHLIDDLNVAGIAGNQGCQLRLARLGSEIISKLNKKYPKIILCGYSLGGTTTACLCSNTSVLRGIVFNGGAPPSNAPRPTPKNCRVYHIVGDILSTHFIDSRRIYLVESDRRRPQTEEYLQTDGIQWYDIAYYHDLERFMDFQSPYEIVDAQFEQNSLENYFFHKPKQGLDILGSVAGIISVDLNFRKKIQLQICRNPIPGSYVTRACTDQPSNIGEKIAGGVIGGGLGGLAAGLGTGGAGAVPGAIAGATAGAALASGEKGLLDVINPELVDTVKNVGGVLLGGTSLLDRINNGQGKFTGQIVGNGDRNVFGTMGGLVSKPNFKT